MTTYTVTSSQPLSGQTLSGDTVIVLSGGIATDLVLTGFGDATVSSGGTLQSSTLTDFEEVVVSSGGSATSNTVSGGFEVLSGGTSLDALISTGGYQDVTNGVASNTSVVGLNAHQNLNGGMAIDAVVSGGASQDVDGTAVASNTVLVGGGSQFVDFGGTADGTVVGSGGLLQVYSDATASGTTLEVGAVLDLPSLTFVSDGFGVLSAGTDTLTVTEGGTSTSQVLSGDYAGDVFALSVDSRTGTLVTVERAACYCHGTRIQTEAGEVEVQALRIGDRVVTASGVARGVRWLGRRSYAARFTAANRSVWPVRIRAGALAIGLPRRDLFVSPEHALLLEGVLIPAGALLNGTTITQPRPSGRIDYVHVELDTHDVILAEGVPADSFVDDDSRGLFSNAAEYARLYPDAPPGRAVLHTPA